MGAVSVIEFPEGEVIVKAGARDPRVLFVQSGSLELLAGDAVVASLGQGDFVGLAAALDNQAAAVTVRAGSDVELLAFNPSEFESLIQTHPEIACAMLMRQDARLQAILSGAAGGGVDKPKAPKRPAKAKPKTDTAPVAIVLSLGKDKASYTLEPGRAYVVGRKDPATGAVPDIDFSELAEGHTVSRQHAVLECNKGQWQLSENKPTANGSYVNEQRVAEGKPVAVKPGDKLVFGLIVMEVSKA